MDAQQVPTCPGDDFRMVATIAGWRCPLCGLAVLGTRGGDDLRARAAHPAFGAR